LSREIVESETIGGCTPGCFCEECVNEGLIFLRVKKSEEE